MKEINSKIIDAYRMNQEREALLWKDAIIVFDSCALLDFYFIPKKTRSEIFKDIFRKLNQRLWIPFHVQYEYLKNRKKVLKKPVSKNYTPIKKIIKELQNDIKASVQKKIIAIQQDTKNDTKHPYIDQSKIDAFKAKIDGFLKEINDFELEMLKEIDDIEKDILSVENNDDILKSIEKYFKTGREYTFNEIIEITKEGKHRFEFQIPPGYGDFENKDKKGTQIFGDLIIWKQILEFAHQKQLPIIFITNDIKKNDDWCYLDPNTKEDRILMPREELIKEIKDYANVDFWMYNFPQFLYHSKNYLKATISKESIQNISELLNEREDVKLRYYHANIVILNWLKDRYPDEVIVENKRFPDFIIEHPFHLEGLEVKLINNHHMLISVLKNTYEKGWNSIQKGDFNEFKGIFIIENEEAYEETYRKIKLFKEIKRNEFVSYIIGIINDDNEFIILSDYI